MTVKNKYKDIYVLSEKDFYPPSDDRVLGTNIKELYKGEFNDYAEYIYDLYEEEEYYEN